MNLKPLPTITDKQKEIVDLVFQFRFINRHQIQRLFNHKDARRINTWLRDLVSKRYLGRIYSHKLLENTKPAIYYLSNTGIIYQRYRKGEEYQVENEQLEFKHMKKFYDDKHASKTFITHCVTIAEFYTQLKEWERDYAGKKETIEYMVETKTEMWITNQLHRYPHEDFNTIKQSIPDLYIDKETNLGEKNAESQTFLLELFDPHVPKYAIVHKIKQFIQMKENGSWEAYADMNVNPPTILLIFPHYRKLNLSMGKIREALDLNDDLDGVTFLTTTYQKAMTEGITNNEIWRKLREE